MANPSTFSSMYSLKGYFGHQKWRFCCRSIATTVGYKVLAIDISQVYDGIKLDGTALMYFVLTTWDAATRHSNISSWKIRYKNIRYIFLVVCSLRKGQDHLKPGQKSEQILKISQKLWRFFDSPMIVPDFI